MDLKDWVKAARKSKGLTQEALGEIMGRTKANIGHWESGQHAPSYEQMQRISKATGYPMPGSGALAAPPTPAIVQIGGGSPADPTDVAIRQFNTGGRMGPGLVLKEQPGVIRNWNVSEEWVRKNVPYYSSIHNLAIVTGFGDSMLGMFNPGDPLLVDTGITKADVDGVYFFRVGEEGFIKRLQRIPGQGILVISENQKYRDWTITADMDFEVFSKVLKAWRGENL